MQPPTINKNNSHISNSNNYRAESLSNSRIQQSIYNNKLNKNSTKSLNKIKSNNNNNKKNNSSINRVLTNILDTKKKFNIYSPSELKQISEEIKII